MGNTQLKNSKNRLKRTQGRVAQGYKMLLLSLLGSEVTLYLELSDIFCDPIIKFLSTASQGSREGISIHFLISDLFCLVLYFSIAPAFSVEVSRKLEQILKDIVL